MRDFPPWMAVAVVGGLLFAALHQQFLTVWEESYTLQPWPGYVEMFKETILRPWRTAMQEGGYNSPLWLTGAAPAGIGLLLGMLRSADSPGRPLALWIGIVVPLLALLVTRTVLAGQEMGAMGAEVGDPVAVQALLFEPVRVGVSVVVGIAAAAVIRNVAAILTGPS